MRAGSAGFGAGVVTGVALSLVALMVNRSLGCGRRPSRVDDDGGPLPTGPLLVCSLCRVVQPVSGFSTRQAKRKEASRKCAACVEKLPRYVEAPAPPAEEAPRDQPSAPPAAREVAGEGAAVDVPEDPLRLARKAETVLRGRTDRIVLVLEHCTDDFNHVAVLRTCEAMGLQHVWLVKAPLTRTHGDTNKARQKSRQQRKREMREDYDPLLSYKRAQMYTAHLDVRVFDTARQCVEYARADGRELWATDLAQCAVVLDGDRGELRRVLPERLAVVMGQECAGVSEYMLGQATRRVYLPMAGFTESFNLTVATALVLQRLLDACETRGLAPVDAARLRLQWYTSLARSAGQRREFAALAAAGGVEPWRDMRRPQEHRTEYINPRLRRRQEHARQRLDGQGS